MFTRFTKALDPLREATLRGLARLATRTPTGQRERGDVPGWVLVTIMTAGLVTALWLVADDKLRDLFSEAMDGVTGP
jgi:hypothetical protein